MQQRVDTYTSHMTAMEYRKAMHELREIWAAGNAYLASAAPWEVIKEDEERAACILRTAINLIPIFAQLAAPIIPTLSKKMASILTSDITNWPADVSTAMTQYTAGTAFNLPEVLIQKIEDTQIAEMTERFGGEKEAA